MSKVIYVIYFASILLIANIGGAKMDSAIIGSIIGAAVLIIIDIMSNIRAWKNCKSMIGNSESNKSLTAMLGSDGTNTKSLSGQHEDIQAMIQNNSSELQSAITQISNTVNKLEYQSEIEKVKEQERNRMLTNEQIDIQDTIKNIGLLFKIVEKQNSEIGSLKSKINQLQAENELLNSENQDLRSQLGITSPNSSRK